MAVRYGFEGKPDEFLALFDSSHTSGSSERGNVRAWDAAKREEIGRIVGAEARRLLDAVSVDEPEAVPPPSSAEDGGRLVEGKRSEGRRSSVMPPPDPPSAEWLEAAERVEAAWRVVVEL